MTQSFKKIQNPKKKEASLLPKKRTAHRRYRMHHSAYLRQISHQKYIIVGRLLLLSLLLCSPITPLWSLSLNYCLISPLHGSLTSTLTETFVGGASFRHLLSFKPLWSLSLISGFPFFEIVSVSLISLKSFYFFFFVSFSHQIKMIW